MTFKCRFNATCFLFKINRFVLIFSKTSNRFVLKICSGGFADYSGEDGSLALGLKKYGKIKFVRSRKARAVTGYGTISADGSLFNSFWKRTVKGINNFTSLFHYKEKYEDEDSNLIK